MWKDAFHITMKEQITLNPLHIRVDDKFSQRLRSISHCDHNVHRLLSDPHGDKKKRLAEHYTKLKMVLYTEGLQELSAVRHLLPLS